MGSPANRLGDVQGQVREVPEVPECLAEVGDVGTGGARERLKAPEGAQGGEYP